MEVLIFTPPTLDNSGPQLLKVSHNKGQLAFCNPSGEPPAQNPPLNETRIRHHRTQSNHSSEFQEGENQCEAQYNAPPPINQLPEGFHR